MSPACRAPSRSIWARAWLQCGALLGVCFLLTGCAHYQLGTEARLKFTTLFIAPVTNNAGIPQAEALISTQLREAFIRDGRVKVVNSPEQADATLQISLHTQERLPVVSRSDDAGLARRFEVTLRASATLTDNRTQQPYFVQRPLTAKRGVFTDSGLVTAEYQNLTLLAEDLGQQATHAVLDVW